MDVSTAVGLRDRATIAVMIYTFARVGAAIALNVEDYYSQKKRWWLRLREKNGKLNEMPCHHKLESFSLVCLWVSKAPAGVALLTIFVAGHLTDCKRAAIKGGAWGLSAGSPTSCYVDPLIALYQPCGCGRTNQRNRFAR
jgi:hypothetical protein